MLNHVQDEPIIYLCTRGVALSSDGFAAGVLSIRKLRVHYKRTGARGLKR
jgi:hypothetical protein